MTITAAAPRAASYRGRLRWWTELPLVAVMYFLYSTARLAVRGDVDDALAHGAGILHFEQWLHIDPERWLNRLFVAHTYIGVPADFEYASLHYVVTPSVLVWLWHRRPTHYRTARTWLLISTLIGLGGFTVLPTAPPRLLETGDGFVDTMAKYGSYGWWGTDASAPRGMGHLTNQYAAMPSLHVGWSLWCGVILWRYGRNRVVRVLGLLYPLTTTFVVMGTANHYLMDALAGATVMLAGFLLAPRVLGVVDMVRARVMAALPLPSRGPGGSFVVAGRSIPLRRPAAVPRPASPQDDAPPAGTDAPAGSGGTRSGDRAGGGAPTASATSAAPADAAAPTEATKAAAAAEAGAPATSAQSAASAQSPEPAEPAEPAGPADDTAPAAR